MTQPGENRFRGGAAAEVGAAVCLSQNAGKVNYVGVTNNIERRAAEQFAAKGISIEPVPVGVENAS